MFHPFTYSIRNKIAGITVLLSFFVVLCGLLVVYVDMNFVTAATDGLCYTISLSFIGYHYWYIMGLFHTWQRQVIMAMSTQGIILAGTIIFLDFIEPGNKESHLLTIPLHLVFGILCWIVLLQWYNEKRTEKKELKEESIVQEKQPEVEKSAGTLDRISVKNGTQIHMIHIDELFYIQAYGDYVFLFTEKEKYIKEQTMKYLEANLPDSFVRIHRSYLVNTNKISRIELFGKESYQIRLKNDTCLRASNGGYKLLKEKLML